MDYKILTDELKSLETLRIQSPVSRTRTYNGLGDDSYGDGVQGEYDEFDEIYKSPIDGIFIKLRVQTDSYGNNENVVGIEFVQAKQKVVDTYENV